MYSLLIIIIQLLDNTVIYLTRNKWFIWCILSRFSRLMVGIYNTYCTTCQVGSSQSGTSNELELQYDKGQLYKMYSAISHFYISQYFLFHIICWKYSFLKFQGFLITKTTFWYFPRSVRKSSSCREYFQRNLN